jgi:LmbE family N-acetylglucosaminyl deacetylase
MFAHTMVVFAPHPDDETLACGGTIIKKIQEGFVVHVVVMTDGRHSHDLTLHLMEPPPKTIAEIRGAEFRQATKILGVDPRDLVLLGFEDSKLKEHVAEAKERTVKILCEIRPVELYVPYRDDANEDHRATYEIVSRSAREVNFLFNMFEYPMWNGRVARSGLKVLVIDIRKELGRKMEALSKYKSQVTTCFLNQERPILSQDFVKMFCSESETFYTEE